MTPVVADLLDWKDRIRHRIARFKDRHPLTARGDDGDGCAVESAPSDSGAPVTTNERSGE